MSPEGWVWAGRPTSEEAHQPGWPGDVGGAWASVPLHTGVLTDAGLLDCPFVLVSGFPQAISPRDQMFPMTWKSYTSTSIIFYLLV